MLTGIQEGPSLKQFQNTDFHPSLPGTQQSPQLLLNEMPHSHLEYLALGAQRNHSSTQDRATN